MAHATEAEALLASGALYHERALLWPEAGPPVFVGRKAGAFSVYHGDGPIYHFDDEGRWQRAYLDGRHYLKALDTTVQALDRVRTARGLELERRSLGRVEAAGVDARVREDALELAGGRFRRAEAPTGVVPLRDEDLVGLLARVVRWDGAAWLAQRERYRSLYGPVSFLPPDDLNSLLLQATVGHADGVAFGAEPVTPHRARAAAEFEAHARGVAGLLGLRVAQFRNVFLAGSDLLLRPVELAGYLETLGRVFAVDREGRGRGGPGEVGARPLAGVHAFADRFPEEAPGLELCRLWRGLGLTRVTLGVESGDPAARARAGKTWTNEGVCRLASALAGAGVALSVVLLAEAADETQRGATEALLLALPLKPGALVSVVDGAGGSCAGGFARLKAERRVKVVAYRAEKQGLTGALSGGEAAPENGASVQSGA